MLEIERYCQVILPRGDDDEADAQELMLARHRILLDVNANFFEPVNF